MALRVDDYTTASLVSWNTVSAGTEVQYLTQFLMYYRVHVHWNLTSI